MAVGRRQMRPQKSGKIDKGSRVHKWPFFRYLLSTQIFFFLAEATRHHPCLLSKEKKVEKSMVLKWR